MENQPGQFSGSLNGSTARERAVAAAGLLAEAGVTGLVLGEGGVETILLVRETDLPGLMEQTGKGELIAESLNIRLEFDDTGARWNPLRGEQV